MVEQANLEIFAPSFHDTFPIMSYPARGGRRAIPSGRTLFDFKQGTVKRPDVLEYLSADLISAGFEEIRSGFLWGDGDVILQGYLRGLLRGQFLLEQCNLLHFQFFPIDSLEVVVDLPCNVLALFSTANQSPQVNGIGGHQERYGDITTVDSWVNILFGPTEGGELASSYRKANIYVGSIGAKVFLVHNTGSNDADVNFQLIHNSGKRWVDSFATGASLNVPAGDNAVIEDGTPTGFVRLRARSRTAGSPTTLEIQYRGFSGIR